MFEYKIPMSNGYTWYLTTDEDPLEVCERAGLLDLVIAVETLEMVGA